MLRFGLVGFGTHARWAVRQAIENAEKAQLVAIADINPESLAEVDDPDLTTYTSHREMIDEEDLDAVYIATPANAHAEPTIDALEAGLHVLCEKPMAENAEDCQRMVEAAEVAPGILGIDFEARFAPYTQRIRAWIEEGLLGAVKAIHWQQLWDGHKAFGPIAPRRARLTNLAGSLDCSIHKLDLSRFFVGGGEWEAVHALGMWFGEDLEKPPHTSMLARLSGDVLVTLNSSFAYTAYIEPVARSNMMTIVGTKGVIDMHSDHDTEMPQVKLVSKDLTETIPMENAPHGLAIAWVVDELCDLAMGKKSASILATGHDGLMAQLVTDEVNRQAVARRVD
jgi:predicted dehydrogenase